MARPVKEGKDWGRLYGFLDTWTGCSKNGENLEMQGIDRRGRDRVGDLIGLLHTGQEKQTMLLELNHPSLDTMA